MTPPTFLTIIPTSVIDIAAQKKRSVGGHGTTSSRAEYSPFPKEIATLCTEYYLRNCRQIFDPFAGWGERGAACLKQGLPYTGYDISPVALEKAAATYGLLNILANSETSEIPAFDGLFTCPPYWNLEKYASEGGLDRAKTWDTFITRLDYIFNKCYDAAQPGATFCIVVGEWRKAGVYYDLEYETRRIFKNLGAAIFDQVIVSRKKVTKIKVMLPQCKRLGYAVRCHESLLVFKKPLKGPEL